MPTVMSTISSVVYPNNREAASNKSKAYGADIKSLRTQLQKKKQERKVIEGIRDRDLALLRGKLQAVAHDYDHLLQYEDKLRRRGENARLQLEYLRCTTTEPLPAAFSEDEAMPLPPDPFVIVLIDGDAYGVSTDPLSNSGVLHLDRHFCRICKSEKWRSGRS